uniref:Uncharacterized protein n=1 Tax=Glossina brevipalpis TaxID=37001 RepID=A0A1A9WSX3_9MUSC
MKRNSEELKRICRKSTHINLSVIIPPTFVPLPPNANIDVFKLQTMKKVYDFIVSEIRAQNLFPIEYVAKIYVLIMNIFAKYLFSHITIDLRKLAASKDNDYIMQAHGEQDEAVFALPSCKECTNTYRGSSV